MQYKIYTFSWKEKLLCLGITVGAAAIISWLFYRSIWAMALTALLYYPVKKEIAFYLLKKRRQEMLFHFKEMLQMISASLKSGYSVENAFVEAEHDFVKLYGEQGIIAKEFAALNYQVKVNTPIEELLDDLAERSGIEEISNFAQVFLFAKRGGGDFIKIFYGTVEKIREKAEAVREIETVMAAKRLEQNIMNLVPFGILVYAGLGMPEFLNPLYGNLLGAVVMSICLMIYLSAFKLALSIMNIEI